MIIAGLMRHNIPLYEDEIYNVIIGAVTANILDRIEDSLDIMWSDTNSQDLIKKAFAKTVPLYRL